MSRALFGRDSDLQALSALLDEHRLVSLVWPGGVRKTARASRLTERRRGTARHEVRQVELAALTDSQQVIPAVVRALGLPVSRAPELEVVQAALHGAPHLLV